MSSPTVLANDRIRAPQVRLITHDGQNLGVILTRDAQARARNEGMDLVIINAQSQPMVAKIVDLNKWLYEQKQAEKERAKRNRESEIVMKEVQLRPVTDEHDIAIKARNTRGWLTSNCKVKVVVKFRGREMSHKSLGHDVMRTFLATVGEHRLEREPVLQGNSITAMLLPLRIASPTDSTDSPAGKL